MAKKFEATILGVNSAYPVHGRHPSCQVIDYDHHLIMIDCGEGSQIQLSKYHIKKGKISDIFISHLHGDHCFGLPGLLTSYSLQGRKAKLTVHGPKGLKNFINNIFSVTGAFMTFELSLLEYDAEVENEIRVTPNLWVKTFPLKHRTPTMGFRINEHINELNIDSEKIGIYDLQIEEIKAIKLGANIEREGNTIFNDELTLPKDKERSYAYCSDTVYDESIVEYIKGCDLIYHETTYLDDLAHLAKERMHTTLGQAISIAELAEVDRLIIGHYSSRYSDPNEFLQQGILKFKGLLLGEEGRTYSV